MKTKLVSCITALTVAVSLTSCTRISHSVSQRSARNLAVSLGQTILIREQIVDDILNPYSHLLVGITSAGSEQEFERLLDASICNKYSKIASRESDPMAGVIAVTDSHPLKLTIVQTRELSTGQRVRGLAQYTCDSSEPSGYTIHIFFGVTSNSTNVYEFLGTRIEPGVMIITSRKRIK